MRAAIFFACVLWGTATGGSGKKLTSHGAFTTNERKSLFDDYPTYEEVSNYLQSLSQNYSAVVTLEQIGYSFEFRELYAVKVSTGGNKTSVIIDGGFHSRDWLAPLQALYILDQLVTNPENAMMVNNLNWYIIPIINPDGYEYSRNQESLWKKTRSPGLFCFGVDADRNFDFHWGEEGSSPNDCSEIYSGVNPFSESETISYRDYVNKTGNVQLYLTFQSYGSVIAFPWSYTTLPIEDFDVLQQLGTAVADGIKAHNGSEYRVGAFAEMMYTASGTSLDYAKGVLDIMLTYSIKLPAGGSSGYDPPASMILPVARDIWAGLLVFYDYLITNFA